MNARQLLVSAGLAVSLAFGVDAALAQDTSTPDSPTEQRGFRPNRPLRDHRLRTIHSLELAEQYTGLNISEMRTALQSGQSLADLISANGQRVDDFISAVLEPFNARIDRAVENGRITAERAEAMKTQAQERITAWVNGESSASIAMILGEF